MEDELKVGELAQRTGVSVRTLHYYEEVGLLEPASRTSAGHRLFGRREIERLQQIRSLVQLGLSLEEVKAFLGDPGFSPLAVLEMHIAHLDDAIEAQGRLRRRLADLARRLSSAEAVGVDDFLDAIKETTMFEKYYSPEQLEELAGRREAMGPEAMEKAQDDWAELIALVKAEMEKGTDPATPEVRELAQRWQGLVDGFTQQDPEITRSLGNLWANEREKLEARHAGALPTADMMAYIAKALAQL